MARASRANKGRARVSAASAPPRPAGRAGMADLQRSRLIAATLEIASAQGGTNLTVGAIVHQAGISRRTFYELFSDREECLLATIDHALAGVSSRVLAAYDPAAPWRVRLRAGLEALLRHLEEEPLVARLLVVESLKAGGRAQERRAAAIRHLVAAVDGGKLEAKTAVVSPLAAEGVVGAVLHVLHERVNDHHGARLIELLNFLMSMIVLPYLGPVAADKELTAPSPSPSPSVRSAPPPAGVGSTKALPVRLTYRTVRVLQALAENPGVSNKTVAKAAGIVDQGQVSKLLARLQRAGLIVNDSDGSLLGAANVWRLSPCGVRLQSTIDPSYKRGSG